MLGQHTACTNGFLESLLSISEGRLVPLLGRHDSGLRREQWIFPGLRFSCPGTLTGWTISLIKGADFDTSCPIHITTWRPDSDISTLYTRISTTRLNIENTTRSLNQSLYTFELYGPAIVEPGDIVGVETEFTCDTPENIDNIRSLNVSESNLEVLSYRSSFSGTTFFADPMSTSAMSDLIPLLVPAFGQFNYHNKVLSPPRLLCAQEWLNPQRK